MVFIYADLGCNNADATNTVACDLIPFDTPDEAVSNIKYLDLIEHALTTYPNNTIIWLHLGISSQQQHMDPTKHVAILRDMMTRHPNLWVDISWGSVLRKYFFDQHGKVRQIYVDFLNEFSDRIITGSDYVAYANKTSDTYSYNTEVTASSLINLYLNDKAYRNIALGQSYLKLMHLDNQYSAPEICQPPAQ